MDITDVVNSVECGKIVELHVQEEVQTVKDEKDSKSEVNRKSISDNLKSLIAESRLALKKEQAAASSTSFTVLAPWEQEKKEKKALFQDARLKEILDKEEIRRIEKSPQGYTVYTDSFRVEVVVHYTPNNKCGPVNFTFEFLEKEPLEVQS